MTNPDDQAFPRSYAYQNPEAGKSELKSIPGLTKREYFALEMMKALVIAHVGHPDNTQQALFLAESLLAALNKEAKP
jgi:hypothetical protein